MGKNAKSNSIGTTGPTVLQFDITEPDPDPIQPFLPSYIGQPIIIDNGTYECRAGFACNPNPSMVFRNKVARTKARGNEAATILVGNEVKDSEWTRYNTRQIFDGGIVTSISAQEDALDHIFDHLDITTPTVDHPIVMTEPLCNPNYCRQRMNELLFECYSVPATSYGVDAMFAFHQSNAMHGLSKRDGIVISCGHSATYIMPVVNGQLDATNCKRLDIGGQRLWDYMAQLMYLKHPHLRELTYPARVQKMFCESSYVAPDYHEELNRWTAEEYAKDTTRIYQLPFVKPGQLTDEERQKKREEQGQRLKEFMNRKREREIKELQARLDDLQMISELPTDGKIRAKAKERGFKTIQELYNAITELEDTIRRKRNKLLGITEPEIEPPKKEYVFDLVDKDDKDLTEEQKKEKRKQRFIKNAGEGRERARLLRVKAQEEKEEQERLEEERRKADPKKWLQELNEKKQEVLKQRQLRLRKKAELQNRRSAASKQRMRIIMQQANDDQATRKAKKGTNKEDTFGIDDSHWDVYREIAHEEEHVEEMEQEALTEIEQQLATYDPDYIGDDTMQNPEEYHQLHLEVERTRVPEALFQPSMIGNTKAGLVEMLSWILGYYPPDVQDRIVQNIHVTGGISRLPNFAERLKAEIMAIRPFGSQFRVTLSDQPELESWRGARSVVREWQEGRMEDGYISRADYMEMGGEYLKEHACSNRYYPTPTR